MRPARAESLQEYLRKALIDLASRPDPQVLAELIDAPLATVDDRLAGSPGPTCAFRTPNESK